MQLYRFAFLLVFLMFLSLSVLVVLPASSAPTTPQGEWTCYDDGTTPDPCRNTLYDIEMLSASDGWAVGDNGIILRWNGSIWQSVTSPLTNTNSPHIDMISATDGWILSDSSLLHWNGTQWTVATNIYRDGYDIDMRTATDGWIAAGSGVFHWNGTSWSETFTNSDYSFNRIVGISATETWAIAYKFSTSQDVLLQWDGTTWTDVISVNYNVAIYSFDMLSSEDGWIGGYDFTNGQAILLRWDGSSLTPATLPASYYSIDSIEMLATDDVWAVNIDARLIHWDGSVWTEASSEFVNIYGFDMVSDTEAWVVGDGGFILRWNGTTYEPTIPPPDCELSPIKWTQKEGGI